MTTKFISDPHASLAGNCRLLIASSDITKSQRVKFHSDTTKKNTGRRLNHSFLDQESERNERKIQFPSKTLNSEYKPHTSTRNQPPHSTTTHHKTSFPTNTASVHPITTAPLTYLHQPAPDLLTLLLSALGYATPVFSSLSNNASRSGTTGGHKAYTIGVAAETTNCSQKTGGQPRRVMKNSRRWEGVSIGALDQRFGICAGLRVRARLRERPVRVARMKRRWIRA